MFILDTDILTILDLQEGEFFRAVIARIRDHSQDPFFTTIVSFEEQMRGWLAYIAKSRTTERQVAGYERLARLVNEFGQRPMLGFDAPCAKQFERLRKAGVRIGSMDLKIASIAIANGATLITRNLRDFKQVPNLRCEDWTI